jgi:hypothetical protein
MTTIFGYKKGLGVRPLKEQPGQTTDHAQNIEVHLRSRAGEASTEAQFVCTVDGCGKKFKKLVPMAMNHFRAKHPEVDTSKDAYKQYVKPISEV